LGWRLAEAAQIGGSMRVLFGSIRHWVWCPGR